ncbi:MAG: sigma 54-interacting transcriptional regulator [Negativicutes bacterium]|nr:sigma 54-interacting transcriptional regulator [Negativicutes bacterium]
MLFDNPTDVSPMLKGLMSSPQAVEEWYLKILDSIDDGILVADQSTVVRYINPEYTRITGVPREKIVGRRLTEVRPGAMLPGVIRSGKSMAGVYRREGDVEYVVDMAPIIIDDKIFGGVSVVKDITEVQRLNDELHRFTNKTRRLKHLVDRMYRARYTFKSIIGRSAAIAESVLLAGKAARGHSDVLITGESGTGKEVFAQAIHNASAQAPEPFVAVSCAAIPPSLMESELFGFDEGVFTGAKKGGKLGLFEIASGGTIFIDEIGELSLELQAKLLRVLQERTVRRLGEAGEVPVDIRVIAATNRDLSALVSEGKFREDLYYRLNVLNIHLSPLRQRLEDVPLLTAEFLAFYSQRTGRCFEMDEQVAAMLGRYGWPGNIRELRNVVEYAVNVCESGLITVQHLPLWLQAKLPKDKTAVPTLAELVLEAERKAIVEMLQRYGRQLEGKKKIARDLGISLATLYNKMKACNIPG